MDKHLQVDDYTDDDTIQLQTMAVNAKSVKWVSFCMYFQVTVKPLYLDLILASYIFAYSYL